jgi:hypothetical protein
MADAVTSQTIQDSDRIAVMKFTNLSDGTGEAAVLKVDISTFSPHSRTGYACTSVSINRIWYTTVGMSVDILWDASVDVPAWTIDGYNFFDFRGIGPLTNNGAGGVTGDIKFTTVGHSSGDRYTILMEMSKDYAVPVPS